MKATMAGLRAGPAARALPLFLLIVSVCGFQLGAALAKPLFATGTAAGLSALRLGFAAVILVAMVRPWRQKVDGRLAGVLLAYGLGLAGLNLFFYLAIRTIPLGLTVAIEFLGPLGLALATSRRLVDAAWALVAGAGILLLVPTLRVEGGLDPVGVGFALASACCWVAYIVFGQRASRAMPPQAAAAVGVAVAALAVLPFGIAAGGAALLRLDIWPMALLIAVVSGVGPYLIEMMVLKQLPARVFGVLMSLEPAFGALFGAAVLGQHLSALQGTAILAVMLASAGSAFTPMQPAILDTDAERTDA